jgi:hypothetical protein
MPSPARRGVRSFVSLPVVVAACAAGVLMGALAGAEPDPGQMIKDLERPAQPAPSPTPALTPAPAPGGGGAEVSATTGVRLVREGTFVSSRRGRVSRSITNEFIFAFDADAQGRAEPPMVIMPCQNLMAMERVVERAGESVTFTISGQVFVYKGRNYLLPTLYQVNRRTSELNTGQ